MGNAEIEAANEIYKAAKQDAIIEIEKIKNEMGAVQEESEARGILRKIEYDNSHNEMLKYAVLYQVKKKKEYRQGGMTWEQFCESIGEDRRRVSEILKDMKPIYDNFSAGFRLLLGLPFNKIRYLGRKKAPDSATFEDGCIIIDGAKIPLTPENKDDIEAAIDALKESQISQLENKDATLKAKDRVLEAKEKIINNQEKELHKLTRQVKARGFEPGEENFIQDMESLKTMLVGVELKMDVRNMPPDMTPLMRAAYIETLGHIKRVMIAYYDEATNHYGIEDDDDWVPPYERADNSPGVAKAIPYEQLGAEILEDCAACKFHTAMASKAKGEKLPGNFGKCTRPEGICLSEPDDYQSMDHSPEELGTVDCTTCQWHKGMGNKTKGVKIPGAFGKCTRPEGICISETKE